MKKKYIEPQMECVTVVTSSLLSGSERFMTMDVDTSQSVEEEEDIW